jgi:hypothetical protein
MSKQQTPPPPEPVGKPLLTDAEPEFISLGHGCRYFWPVEEEHEDLMGVGRYGLGLSIMYDPHGKAYHAGVELMTVYTDAEGLMISSTFGERARDEERWTYTKTEWRYSTKSRDAFAAKALEAMRQALTERNRQLAALVKEVTRDVQLRA